jgi:hypothetical protein
MFNKTVYVPADWSTVGEYQTVKVPTGEIATDFFGREKQVTRQEQQFIPTGHSDCDIDADRLATLPARMAAASTRRR